MNKFLLGVILLAAFTAPALSQGSHWVGGYYRHDGTYVPAHYETNPNGNFYDNWSTRGNYNPYTGQPGYRLYPRHHPAYYDRFGQFHPAE
ncbi:MAG TPA: hypothetical protein VGI60_02725 [Chthoniobacterales bacterium]|jgi:hypothetical protein